MQFVVTAFDGTDEGALARRQAAREAHLKLAEGLTREGRILMGGAILDDAGRMIGSTLIVDFPSRAALDAWLKTDPYTTGGVWKTVEVRPFRVAVKT
jgi:uncharacterized protein YciI